jgi:hypothetical protein
MGQFKINDYVRIISDNENYKRFLGKTLIVTYIATSEVDHQGYDASMDGMQLMDLETKNGEVVPFSLYEYELERIS